MKILLFMLMSILSISVLAEKIGVATAPGITVSFYNEPCRLEDRVGNLPLRAVWVDKVKTIEGCFGSFEDSNTIGVYFEDTRVLVIPANSIQLLTEV